MDTNNRRPNIILVTCDQLRAFEVGCCGNPLVRTPNIDRLAQRGRTFDTAVTQNPVCTPARSCWLTGQYSRTCAGMLGNTHENPPNSKRERLLDPTLPELLRSAGYRTALIGKWHIDPQPQLVGFDSAIYPKIEHRYYGQTLFDEDGNSTIVTSFLEDFFAENVATFLSEQRYSDTPFFLNYNISPPHQPIGPGHLPEQYTRMYRGDEVLLRPNTEFEHEAPHDPEFWFRVYRSADYYWDWRGKRPIKPEDDFLPAGFGLLDLTALYYGAVTCVDDYIGKLMDTLDQCGLTKRTLIVFTSDHGDNLGSHGLFNKDSLIEEAIRVPLIIANPQLGVETEEQTIQPAVPEQPIAGLIDIAPTILDSADLAVPAHMQGQSLLRGRAANEAFIETGPMIGIRTKTHLLGLPFDEKHRRPAEGKSIFYDLRNDPYEQRNLKGTGEQREIYDNLRERLLEWDHDCPWMEDEK